MGRIKVSPNVKLATNKKRVVTTNIHSTRGDMNSTDAKKLYNDIIRRSIKQKEAEGWTVSAFVRVLTKAGWITVDPANLDVDDYFNGRAGKTGQPLHSSFEQMSVTIISKR